MNASAVPRLLPILPKPAASSVAALFVDEIGNDIPGVAIPRPEVQLVVRFGPSTRDGLDVHAMGGRDSVHRKLLRRGQQAVTAHLQLGTAEAVLGVPAYAIAGSVVALEDLWGEGTTRRLRDRLANARDMFEASAIFGSAIEERVAHTGRQSARTRLVLDAAARFTKDNGQVGTIATDLGVSERHLRRVFRETIGLSPKTFAKLRRFGRALRDARAQTVASWATIAADAGYYDQAHLITEFRAIAGATPAAFLRELRTAQSFG